MGSAIIAPLGVRTLPTAGGTSYHGIKPGNPELRPYSIKLSVLVQNDGLSNGFAAFGITVPKSGLPQDPSTVHVMHGPLHEYLSQPVNAFTLNGLWLEAGFVDSEAVAMDTAPFAPGQVIQFNTPPSVFVTPVNHVTLLLFGLPFFANVGDLTWTVGVRRRHSFDA